MHCRLQGMQRYGDVIVSNVSAFNAVLFKADGQI